MSTINEQFKTITESFGKPTSEELLGLKEQPKNNCPYINFRVDCLFSDIRLMSTYIESIEKETDLIKLKETANVLKEQINNLCEHETVFNELRTRFESLREWGENWKQLCKQIIIEETLVEKYKKA